MKLDPDSTVCKYAHGPAASELYQARLPSPAAKWNPNLFIPKIVEVALSTTVVKSWKFEES
jgi:hypothetical protein